MIKSTEHYYWNDDREILCTLSISSYNSLDLYIHEGIEGCTDEIIEDITSIILEYMGSDDMMDKIRIEALISYAFVNETNYKDDDIEVHII